MNNQQTQKDRYHIHRFPEVDSTMRVAKDMALAGCPDWTVIVADRQTGGRGRMDRQWQSDRGGLYFTIVRRPPVRPTEGFKYTFIAAFVLADLLRTICNIDAGLKWPNDILVDKKKLSGMLSAMQASQNRIDFLNIGIGLNVNNTLSHAAPDAIALQEIAGTPFSRQDVLTRFLDRLQDNSYDTMPPAEAINRWKQYAIGIHHTPVRVVTLRETVQGIAEDVDNTGALVVRLHDGTRRRISVGDCFI